MKALGCSHKNKLGWSGYVECLVRQITCLLSGDLYQSINQETYIARLSIRPRGALQKKIKNKSK